MNIKTLVLLGSTLLLLSACTGEKKKESITEGGMKCGPGKCGASMVDGSAALVKKKMNILDQIKEDDTRRDCVLKSKTTKALYNCVRVGKTGRLSTKCSSDNTKPLEAMKCETGKCSGGKDIPLKEVPVKESASMKCEAGKCNSSM
jgi:hypothetical protein